MTRTRKYALIAAGLVAMYFILVFFGASALLTRMVPERLAGLLGRTVLIEKIRVNPLSLSLTVRGFEVKEADGAATFVRFDRLYVNAEILSVIKGGLVLKALKLEGPNVHLLRREDGTFNVSDLMADHRDAEQSRAEEPADEASRPFYFSLADIAIDGGAVTYRDLTTGAVHTLSPINLALPMISNLPANQDRFSKPVLSFTVDGATLTVDVQAKPFKETRETVVDLSLSGLSIPNYTAHIPPGRVHFTINQGTVDVEARMSFRKEADASVVEAQGKLTLTDLDVTDADGGPLVALPRLAVTLLPSLVTDHRVHIGDLRIQSPILTVVRRPDGEINLATLVSTPPDEATSETATDTATGASASETSPAFRFDLDRFVLENGLIRFADHAPAGDAAMVETTLNGLNVTVSDFSTTRDRSSVFDLTARLNDAAPIRLNGQMTLTPLAVESDLAVSDLALAWGQPYLPDHVALVITGGKAAAYTHLSLSMTQDDALSFAATGQAAVKGFVSTDPALSRPFLGWDDFRVEGLKVSMAPLSVSVDTIVFDNLTNHLHVFEDGTTSLEKIFITEDKPAQAPEISEPADTPSDVTPIRIGAFVMNNTNLHVTDRSLAPPYATRMTMKTLRVTGLTSEDFKAADVKAEGTLDGYAPVTLTGTINPLSRDLFVDLDVSLANVEMSPFSAYTGKFIGRAIEKGKLNLDVQYLIKDKAITAGNHLVLDRFTLGQTVDSPEALNLPVGLAVSLLTDRKGMIDINLPVSGRTDDPEFAWGKVALKALGNLIMKAATSPFALVGSLVGGGEELRFIEFEPGTSEVDEAGREKLDAIRTLLVERPALRLEILGYMDPDTDKKALARLSLERRITAPERADAARQGLAPAAIVLPPETRQRRVRDLYKKEVLARLEATPLNDPGPTLEEMEAALCEGMVVADADLQILAMHRAEQVRAVLLDGQAISAERVFLKKPDILIKTASDGFKPGRVELGFR